MNNLVCNQNESILYFTLETSCHRLVRFPSRWIYFFKPCNSSLLVKFNLLEFFFIVESYFFWIIREQSYSTPQLVCYSCSECMQYGHLHLHAHNISRSVVSVVVHFIIFFSKQQLYQLSFWLLFKSILSLCETCYACIVHVYKIKKKLM